MNCIQPNQPAKYLIQKVFVISIFYLMSGAWGQVGGINSQLSMQFPTTPNAAEMTRYGKINIGEFTGTMQHSGCFKKFEKLLE